MARQHQRYTAEQWADLIKEQQASGDPIEVFCARKRIGASTFTKWRRRFQDGWNVSSHRVAEVPPRFVEAVSPSAAVVSLVLGKDVRLELPVALGSEKIAELTHAVTSHERN
jgi:hypothetical protein